MCDEQDAHALLFERAHQTKQFFDLFFIEGRGRFIQNQNLAVHADCAGDGHHLLDGNRKMFQRGRHINRDVQIVHQLLCHFEHGLPVDRTQLCFRLAANKQILRHAEVRAQIDLLIDRGDSDFLGILRGMVVDISLYSIHFDLTVVTLVHTCEAFDNRGFSCAVFTHQGVDLALPQRQLRMIKRDNTRKGLGNVAHRN